MKKKIIALFCMGTMIFGTAGYLLQNVLVKRFGVTASAETYGDYEYRVIDGNSIDITNYKGTDIEVIVPDNINGKPVTSISGAFINCENLTSITLPSSITNIRDYTFYDCSYLTNITIPDNVTNIGKYSFFGCTNLSNVVISNNISTIGENAFCNCSSLISVTIPDSVTSIGSKAFGYYYNSKTYKYDKITSFKVYSNIGTKGEAYAIDNEFELEYIDDTIDYYEYIDYVTSEESEDCEENCIVITKYKGLNKEVIIPDIINGKIVKCIGYYAFKDATNITKLTIPDSVTNIGYGAFIGCINLERIDFPNNLRSINAYNWGCTNLTSLTIPDGVTNIDENSFRNCKKLTKVTISNNVISIGDFAFEDCENLTSIMIPDSVESIGNSAFNGCTSLVSVTIPDSVTSIGKGAFNKCSSLKIISIPKKVSNIGDYAFTGCTSLTNINVDKYNPYYCSYNGILFDNNRTTIIKYPEGKASSEYIIPDSVTNIGCDAFGGCANLVSIMLPNGVTSIGHSAFSRCINLEHINLPNSLKSIEIAAFSYCTCLKSIIIPNSITSIENSTFRMCESLMEITIPNGVTSIGYESFYGCKSLNRIILSNSIVSIDNYAFENCEHLLWVIIPNSVKKIGYHAFGYYWYDRSSFLETKVSSTFTIYCYENSEALRYALGYGFEYKLLENDFEIPSLKDTPTKTHSENVYEKSITVAPTKDENGEIIAVKINIETFADICDETTASYEKLIIIEGIQAIDLNSIAEKFVNLTEIVIPDSVSVFDWKKPEGENHNLKIICSKNSQAAIFAVEAGFDVIYNDEKPAFVKGDVNGDGSINITDITKTAAHVKGKRLLTKEQQKRADVNGDNKITITDITKIAAHVKGKRLLK